MPKLRDEPVTKREIPVVVCCPICQRPPHHNDSRGCTFFYRIGNLKIHSNPLLSAAMRSRMFRLYHCDYCSQCRLPAAVCRQKRIAQFLRAVHKNGEYASGPEVTAMLTDRSTCSLRDRGKYTPRKPDWYTEVDPAPAPEPPKIPDPSPPGDNDSAANPNSPGDRLIADEIPLPGSVGKALAVAGITIMRELIGFNATRKWSEIGLSKTQGDWLDRFIAAWEHEYHMRKETGSPAPPKPKRKRAKV